jgi:hypothetical protein
VASAVASCRADIKTSLPSKSLTEFTAITWVILLVKQDRVPGLDGVEPFAGSSIYMELKS